MAKRSSIELDPRAKAAVDEAIRKGGTIDEIVECLEQLGAEKSRSAVGRYVKRARETMDKYRQAQDVAKVWVEKFGAEPEGDVAQLLPHMLRAVAFNQIATMGDNTDVDEQPTPLETKLLAGALKDLASAEKITAERILKVRKETATKAADAVEKEAKKVGGVTADTIAKLRAAVIGTAA